MAEKTFFEKITYTDGIYPTNTISLIQNPNKLYAFPLLGFVIKYIILIPVFLEVIFLSLWAAIAVMLINPFVLLASGKYWLPAYQITLGLLKMNAKISYFLAGLTDKYPGFNLEVEGYTIDMAYPTNLNKLYVFPIFGFLIRMIFMIPFFLYSSVIAQAANLGSAFIAWAVVLFKGTYPEALFELNRDAVRVTMASQAYMTGLSDRYPSFYISMAHDKIKIILIVLSLILSSFNMIFGMDDSSTKKDNTVENVNINNYISP